VRIRYTQPALADLETILSYIASRTPQGARRVQSKIQALVELTTFHPMIGARTHDPTIRRLPILPFPYLVFYEASEDEIIIHAVRHAARDPASMPGGPKS
jgi:toxin ParE1/3/4